MSKKKYECTVKKSLRAWSTIANIKFKKLRSGNPDLPISIQPKNHDADGEGGTTFDEGTMGHAMPFKYGSSYSHLYDKWSWSREQGRGAAVLETTAHELGHCLGLGHSKGREDLMYYATKDIMFTSVEFSETDKRRIQELYGAPTKQRTQGDKCGRVGKWKRRKKRK